MMFNVIGISGVIGSGKSTLCRLLVQREAFHWIEADALVHELYLKGQPGYVRIREYFGEGFVGPKEVYRGKLRRLVLGSQQKLWILYKIMQPLVWHAVNKKIVQIKALYKGKISPPILIEAFYFEERDLNTLIDQLIIVDADDEVIKKRLKKRNIPKKQLDKMIFFQRKTLPKFSKNKIENNGNIEIAYKKLIRSLKGV